jgi:hypothetical protein
MAKKIFNFYNYTEFYMRLNISIDIEQSDFSGPSSSATSGALSGLSLGPSEASPKDAGQPAVSW